MRLLLGKLGLAVVLVAPLTVGWLHAQGQPLTTCGMSIAVPGEYVLASDIGPCAGDGVTITANDVTFDLAGHTITGMSSAANCSTGQIGINVTAAANVRIGGGTVTGFVDGIDFGASSSRVASMNLTNNCFFGMVVSNATNVTIEANSITGSGNDGLVLLNADEGTVQANNISSNGGFGVLLVSNSDHNTLRDNSLNGNGGGGLRLLGGTDTQILRNTAQGNLQGIELHTGYNLVQGNIAKANQTVGITVAHTGAGNNRVEGNTATDNGTFDLTDVNPHCGTNTWQNGIFLTDDVAGVSDGGPGAGCIRGLTTLACADVVCPGDAKPVLLAETGAVDVTGPLPDLGRVQGAVTVGDVTLEGRGLFVGAAGAPRVTGGDWTPLLPGPDIALTDPRAVLNITLPAPVFTAGFDFVEPQTGPNVGTQFRDTTFLLTLEREGVSLRQMAFNAPNDQTSFVSVASDVAFDKMVLSTLTAFRRTDLAFGVKMLGRIYAGGLPVTVRPYDAIVVDRFLPGPHPGVLFRVSPGDGFRTIVNDFADANQGPSGTQPWGVAVEKSREILVVDLDTGTNGRGGLFRIDPVTRQRTLIHDFGDPGQASPGTPLGDTPGGLGLEPTGDILVADAAAGTDRRGALFRVDAVTNVRTLVNDFGSTTEGPLGHSPVDVAVEPSGHILVLDYGDGTTTKGALFRINPATRKRTLLSDFGHPATGVLGNGPDSIAVEASGTILVVDEDGGTNMRGALYRIDPKNGFRTRLSDFGQVAQGPLGGSESYGVAVTPDGTILVVDPGGGTDRRGALFLVDPVTGHRVVQSDFGHPAFGNLGHHPVRVAVLPH